MTELKHSQSTTVFEDYVWTYDAQNRLTSFGSVAEGLTTYGYDARDQLTSVDRSGTASDESYSYDENGNRISSAAPVADSTYATDEYNRLTSDGTYEYAYDDEGNRTSRTEIATGVVTSYEWDHRNRLIGGILTGQQIGVPDLPGLDMIVVERQRYSWGVTETVT